MFISIHGRTDEITHTDGRVLWVGFKLRDPAQLR